MSRCRRAWIRFALQTDDTVDELRGQIQNELTLLGSLTQKGMEKTLERVQLLYRSVSALKSFNLRQFGQYQHMLQTGKLVHAGKDGAALAAVLEALSESKMVARFKEEVEQLADLIAEEGSDTSA